MQSKEKIERLGELFGQRAKIELEILELIGEAKEKPKKQYKKRDEPIQSKKRINHFECEECGNKFKSNLGLGQIKCLKCGSENIKIDDQPEPPVTTKKYVPWTEEEDQIIEDMKTDGKRAKEIGEALPNRTLAAIAARYSTVILPKMRDRE